MKQTVFRKAAGVFTSAVVGTVMSVSVGAQAQVRGGQVSTVDRAVAAQRELKEVYPGLDYNREVFKKVGRAVGDAALIGTGVAGAPAAWKLARKHKAKRAELAKLKGYYPSQAPFTPTEEMRKANAEVEARTAALVRKESSKVWGSRALAVASLAAAGYGLWDLYKTYNDANERLRLFNSNEADGMDDFYMQDPVGNAALIAMPSDQFEAYVMHHPRVGEFMIKFRDRLCAEGQIPASNL